MAVGASSPADAAPGLRALRTSVGMPIACVADSLLQSRGCECLAVYIDVRS